MNTIVNQPFAKPPPPQPGSLLLGYLQVNDYFKVDQEVSVNKAIVNNYTTSGKFYSNLSFPQDIGILTIITTNSITLTADQVINKLIGIGPPSTITGNFTIIYPSFDDIISLIPEPQVGNTVECFCEALLSNAAVPISYTIVTQGNITLTPSGNRVFPPGQPLRWTFRIDSLSPPQATLTVEVIDPRLYYDPQGNFWGTKQMMIEIQNDTTPPGGITTHQINNPTYQQEPLLCTLVNYLGTVTTVNTPLTGGIPQVTATSGGIGVILVHVRNIGSATINGVIIAYVGILDSQA